MSICNGHRSVGITMYPNKESVNNIGEIMRVL